MAELKQVKFRGTKLDFVRFQARHSIPLQLSDGEIDLVAYLFLYQDDAVKKFLEDGHSKSEKSVKNYLSTLRGKGVVVGNHLVSGLADLLVEDPSNRFFTFEITE